LQASGSRSYTNVSPALLAKWDAGGDWVFRASLTHTFARPDYVDLAPISTLDVVAAPDPVTGAPVLNAENETGNPNLRPIESRNWDASAQYNLQDKSGWISLAGFYKELDGLLFDTTTTRANVTFAGAHFDTYTEIMRSNAGEGHVAGVEVSGR